MSKTNPVPVTLTQLSERFSVGLQVVRKLLKDVPHIFQAPYGNGFITYWDAAVAEPVVMAYVKAREEQKRQAELAAQTPPLPVEPPKVEPQVASLTEMFRTLEVMDATVQEFPEMAKAIRAEYDKLHQQNVLIMRKLNEVHELMTAVLGAVTAPSA